MFRIRWRKAVSRKLLDACAKADGARLRAILDAMAHVESSLGDEPEFVGESRSRGERVLLIEPVTVTYKIAHRNRRVHIVRVNLHR